MTSNVWLPILISLVAFLYASVGHGGASGYLAILSFTSTPHEAAVTTALILNLVVAGLSLCCYAKAGHLSLKTTFPFIITSIPAAFIGGLLPISTFSYQLLLAGSLFLAAIRLGTPATEQGNESDDNFKMPPLPIVATSGAVIGLISGLIGVGGGIFLSPLMILMRWASTKQTSATSAAFIVVNALAGLLGRAARQALIIGDLTPLLLSGFVGGIFGSYLGASRFNSLTLRRILAVILLLASLKLVHESINAFHF
jgi:uncharacterized membrane protein YfcA